RCRLPCRAKQKAWRLLAVLHRHLAVHGAPHCRQPKQEVTMGLWARVAMLFRSKTSAALDRAEDPRETLDYAYAQQQELLRKVREGLIEVSTSKKQLERQTQQIQAKVP